MLRALGPADYDGTVRLLSMSPALNLYMLGNLEKHGFGADFCEFWGDFEDVVGANVTPRAVLNRYMNGWSVYGLPDADWRGLAAVMDDHPEAGTRLQDNPGGIESFLPFLRRYAVDQVTEEELMALRTEDFRPASTLPNCEVRRATLADLDALAALYAEAEHMTRTRAAVERPLRHTRVWTALTGGEMRAAALTNAETSGLAMIGGVYTLPAWRGQGLSQVVCSALCAELLGEGIQPFLYWDTPAAGAVYRKLGFHRVGVWRSAWIRRA
jgi:GNAT superfamily N-acetyltransferase